MQIENLIWLAGLFEGEGTTGLYSYKRSDGKTWRISTYFLICNNDPIIINEIYKIAEEMGIGMSIYQRNINHPIWNINYNILCKSMIGVYKMIEAIYPFIKGNKKAVAEMTMRFIKSREFGKTRRVYSKEENDLYVNCKQINQRGKEKTYLSSETLRLALTNLEKVISGDDKVQTSMKVGETIPKEL